jgi:hypothetical protein
VAYFSASGATNLWATAAPDPNNPRNFFLFQYSNGGWQPVQTQALPGSWNPSQVSVAADGSVWLLDGSGTAWQRTMSNPWRMAAKEMPAGAVYIASLTGAGAGVALAVDNGSLIWSFNGIWSQFQATLPGNVVPTQVASGAGGTLWAIDADGNLYQYLQEDQSRFPVHCCSGDRPRMGGRCRRNVLAQ